MLSECADVQILVVNGLRSVEASLKEELKKKKKNQKNIYIVIGSGDNVRPICAPNHPYSPEPELGPNPISFFSFPTVLVFPFCFPFTFLTQSQQAYFFDLRSLHHQTQKRSNYPKTRSIELPKKWVDFFSTGGG